jgi:ATP-binding cassette subfamily C protein
MTSNLVRMFRFAKVMVSRTGWSTALALGFLLLGSLTESASVLLLVPVISMLTNAGGHLTVVAPRGLRLPFSAHLNLDLNTALVGLLVLLVARAALMRWKDVYIAKIFYDFINRLRNDLFASIANAKWTFLSRTRAADLDHALTADIDRVQNLTLQLLLLIQALVLLSAYVIASLLISWPMTLGAAVLGAGTLLALRPIRQRAADYGHIVAAQRQDQYRAVSDFIGGVKIAKSFNIENAFIERLSVVLRNMEFEFLKFQRLNSIGTLVFQVVTAFGIVTFVWVALSLLHLAIPQLIVLVILFSRIAPRFSGLQAMLQSVFLDLGIYDVMQKLQSACEAQREVHPDQAELLAPLSHQIELDQISFAYPAADGATATAPILTNVTAEIEANKVTALIGASGAGKSTLADLLMGLFEPSSGMIRVDGVPLGLKNQRGWREQIAYVPQDVFLLHESIADNLLIAAPLASRDDIWAALRAANAETFVRALPQQLSTIVGDRGVRLSGGERQRIALARALLRKPHLLILDEATSALDWENQILVADTIRALKGSLTIVTIAHRPSMIAFADSVIVVEGGGIVEHGSMAQLSARPTSYLNRLIEAEQREIGANA